jgi:hypothetical protein
MTAVRAECSDSLARIERTVTAIEKLTATTLPTPEQLSCLRLTHAILTLAGMIVGDEPGLAARTVAVTCRVDALIARATN